LRNSAAARSRWPGAIAGRILHPVLPTAVPGAPPLSLPFPFLHAVPSRPPPISLSCSPPRTHRFGEAAGASIRSILHPRLISSSPPSPPPMRLPHQLLPPETPPLWFTPEHRRHPPLSVSMTARSLSIQIYSPLTYHRSCLTAVERHRPKHPPPPPCRAVAWVISAPVRLARCTPPALWELMPSLLLLLVRRLGRVNRTTMSPQSAHGCGDHVGRARGAARLAGMPSHFAQWAEPVG
jgi:hypothetical protein